MISLFKLEDTVLKVSAEAKVLIPEMPAIKEEGKLLSELTLCILSSQEKYEVALAMMKTLRDKNILTIPRKIAEVKKIETEVKKILRTPVSFSINERIYLRRIRFYHTKGSYIVNTIKNIYTNNLSLCDIISKSSSYEETRRNIIYYSCGIGPKQASMFLRNIGFYSEFAVLDKHILDYMELMGLMCNSISRFSDIVSYQKIETKLKSYADSVNVNLLHLDLAIWTTMRILKKTMNETGNSSIGRA